MVRFGLFLGTPQKYMEGEQVFEICCEWPPFCCENPTSCIWNVFRRLFQYFMDVGDLVFHCCLADIKKGPQLYSKGPCNENTIWKWKKLTSIVEYQSTLKELQSQMNVVKVNEAVVSGVKPDLSEQLYTSRAGVYEFIAEMMNSLNSLDIGISVLLIMISLELIASIWSTFTMYDLWAL